MRLGDYSLLDFYRPRKTKFAKVMFSQVSVYPWGGGACMAKGGMHGEGGVHGKWGGGMRGRGYAWGGRGVHSYFKIFSYFLHRVFRILEITLEQIYTVILLYAKNKEVDLGLAKRERNVFANC